MNSLSLESVFQMLLPLSSSNKKWLAEHLYEAAEQEESSSEHKKECAALLSAFNQVKQLREGTLETNDISKLLNDINHDRDTTFI